MSTKQIGARLPVELVNALDKAAAREIRDRSNLIEFILTNWIREKYPELLPPLKDEK